MKLSSKGRFAEPPRLPEHAQSVSEALAGWPDVHARSHWLLGDEREVDGADFYVGENEIGHIHLGGEAHVAVGKTLGAALVAKVAPSHSDGATNSWCIPFVLRATRRPR